MVVQKKKTKLKITTPKSNEFKWTTTKKRAAFLMSLGNKKYEYIAGEVGINKKTLWDWRQEPEFMEEVDKLTLKNENFTRAGLLKNILKGMNIKESYISDDKSTYLDYLKLLKEVLPTETKEDTDPLKYLADAIKESAESIGK